MFNNLVPFQTRRGREIDTLFDRFLQDGFLTPPVSTGIKVDIKEQEDRYIMEAEIPGVQKDQIKVDYDNNYLTISVEQQEEVSEEKDHYICRERRLGKASRTFHAKDIDPEKIEAAYEDGILKVTLPKTTEARRKSNIEIK
ncbi:MAG: Hsp20/alpha crystallin family protein [Bacillota bacterium]|jgi:HSP20 family protein|nr:Hsp20/alpha crystallin family protein [Bacillota bacterium]MDW7677098.1 Hsp20/alpha crystallin family protein [Bacillota bacterium]